MTDKHQSNHTKQLWEEFIKSGKMGGNKLSSIVKDLVFRSASAAIDGYKLHPSKPRQTIINHLRTTDLPPKNVLW